MNQIAPIAPLKELDLFDAAADHFLRGCEERFARVVGHGKNGVTCTSTVTEYVIPGREFVLTDSNDYLVFWIGLNGGRIFFITRFVGKADALSQTFHFSFGGAEKIGWSFNFEPIHDFDPDETSIWGTVDTGQKLIEKRSLHINDSDQTVIMTDAGCFWVNDIAMMLQSLLRTSQRNAVKNSEIMPAPL